MLPTKYETNSRVSLLLNEAYTYLSADDSLITIFFSSNMDYKNIKFLEIRKLCKKHQ